MLHHEGPQITKVVKVALQQRKTIRLGLSRVVFALLSSVNISRLAKERIGETKLENQFF